MRKLSVDELNRLSVEEFKLTKKNPFLLLLDDVRSAHNVGSAFRTADAFLVEKMYLCGITGAPPHREITKTALGADEAVTWEYYAQAVEAATQVKAQGYQLIAVEQAAGSISLMDFQPIDHQRYCFIFGNEVFGVQETLIALADHCLEIPQFGTKHSLNIAVSVGIVLWDVIAKLTSIKQS